jgi:two-component system, sensor histidine kinase ChiS
MKLAIRNKLVIYSVFIIVLTTLATLAGSIILSIDQGRRQNLNRLKGVQGNVEQRINRNLIQFDETIFQYSKKKDLISAARLAITQGKSYFLVSLSGTDFLSLAKDADIDTFAYYSAPLLQGSEKLRLYYTTNKTNFKIPNNSINANKIHPENGLFIVMNPEQTHLFFQSGGIYSRIEIPNPELYPSEYDSKSKIYFEKVENNLILVAHYNLSSSSEKKSSEASTSMGHFIFKKAIDVNLEEMFEDLGIELVFYSADGTYKKGRIPMSNLSLKNMQKSDNELVSLPDKNGQLYDTLIIPLTFKSNIYGYLAVNISQEETTKRVIEYVYLTLLIGAGVILFVILLSYGILNRATKPILTLVGASSAIAKGDLDVPIPVRGHDELATLAESFGQMRDAIRGKIALIIQQKDTLEKNLVTIERKNEELQELDKLRDEFLANTSHELRSPLHGIIGIAEAMLLAQQDKGSTENKSHISMIISNGRRLSKLINDLLDFYKIRESGIQLQQKPLNLSRLVDAILAFCQPLVQQKPISLINQVPKNVPSIYADRSRLEQVLYNLVENAIKFTNSGEIVVSSIQDQENQIKIIVSDTGIGIPEDQKTRIFYLFTQGKLTIEKGTQGTGLGLSIARSLVRLHDSDLHLESEIGKGSRFFFYLRIASEQEIASDPPVDSNHPYDSIPLLSGVKSQIPLTPIDFTEAPPSDTVKTDQSFKIMVIDDEPTNLETLRVCLSLEGYEVSLKLDGESALKSLSTEMPDLILLDLMMPGINGFEVCQQIRKKWDLVTLPVIILSAKSQLKDLEKGFQVGANDYLIKPFQPKEILIRVRTQLLAKTAVEHFREKQLLQEEITYREQLEEELRDTQLRLKHILDEVEDSIICFDQNQAILFFNRGAELCLGYHADQLMGKDISMLVQKKETVSAIFSLTNEEIKKIHQMQFVKYDGTQVDLSAFISYFSIKHEKLWVIIVPSSQVKDFLPTIKNGRLPNSEVGGSEKRSTELELGQLQEHFLQNQERIMMLEEALNSVVRTTRSLENTSIPDTKSHNQIIDQLQETSATNEIRYSVIEVMQKSLECWETSTQKTKLELARESQIWHVNLEDGCYEKTRTLDRYLNLKTLPKNPRIREVVRTANYVLEFSSSETHKIRLEAALMHLRSLSQEAIN